MRDDQERRPIEVVQRRGHGAGKRWRRLLFVVLWVAVMAVAIIGSDDLADVIERLFHPSAPAALDTRLEVGTARMSTLERLHEALRRGDHQASAGFADALAGDEINAVRAGMTAVMIAASAGDPGLLRILLERGGDPNRRGSSERTALQYAAEKNRIEAAKLLLAAGADIDAYDDTRLTPLLMTADRGYTELAFVLIEAGADVDIAHVQGWTPLIDAANGGNTALVRRLLAVGADATARMEDGRSALDFARERGHQEIVRLLQTGG